MIHPTLRRAILAAFALALVTGLAAPSFTKDSPGRSAAASLCQLDRKQRDRRAPKTGRDAQ